MLQATTRIIYACLCIMISLTVTAQAPVNDACSSPSTLTPATTCTNISGTVYLATNAGTPTSTCGTTYDVWYSVATPAGCTALNIDVSVGGGSNLTPSNAFIQAFSGSACSPTPIGVCTPIETTLALTGLSASTTYYVRVFTTGNPTSTPSNKWSFNICATYTPPPANDDCSGAISLTNGVANTAGTVWNASASASIPVGCATGTPDDDVWYKYTAPNTSTTVTLSSIASNLSTSGTRIQLFSGSCGSLTSVACGTTSLSATGLTTGNIYYIRVYSAGAGSIGGTSTGSTFSITASSPPAPTIVSAGRMNEVFQQTILSGANILADPWEITYGTDGYLWITEAKGYKVYRMDPATGIKTTVLDISFGSTFLPAGDQTFNVQFPSSQNPWPQGGFAGLAIHPKFLDATDPHNYVYVSYVHTYNYTAANNAGVFFTNRVVRFTYNTSTQKLELPVSLCDTLPGSSDHNSQRIIIAPVGSTYYLFYAEGDMGAGQFGNSNRPIHAQDPAYYEGKILRFNIDPDTDAGALDKWVPNDNPISGSAVWAIGQRNNQGFAYANINGTDMLYGCSHGPFSDDEINIIERAKNYGHPIVVGYNDGNYDGSKAGSPTGSLPLITSEAANATAIGSSYKDPLFAAYPAPQATINNIYNTNPSNSGWPSEAWSGMDFYNKTFIPGWKNSLVLGSLKWGRVLRFKLNTTGNAIIPTNGGDTISYFGSQNRFRDVAFSPDGKDLYVVMDRSTTTSGPSAANPVVPTCQGCLQKYSFLGYKRNYSTGKSTIPTAIDITDGTLNACTAGTPVTIDNTNDTLWVPITGPDGNIMAEIKANGNDLGLITSSFYTHSGTVREDGSKRLYLNRNITITPAVQPSSTVNIRLYLKSAELTALMGATNSQGVSSGVTSVSDLRIRKNSDPCGGSLIAATTTITPTYAEAHGTGGYVLQGDITSFSSFYIGRPDLLVLPLDLLTFKGWLENNEGYLLWETANESNTDYFMVERSLDGRSFDSIGIVQANGNTSSISTYRFIDTKAAIQNSPVLYYRLKMMDVNGVYKYSNIVVINLADITSITISPNPVGKQARATILSTKEGNAQWSVIDNTGRVMVQGNIMVRKGNNDIIFNTNMFGAGMYYLRVSGVGSEQHVKFQKL